MLRNIDWVYERRNNCATINISLIWIHGAFTNFVVWRRIPAQFNIAFTIRTSGIKYSIKRFRFNRSGHGAIFQTTVSIEAVLFGRHTDAFTGIQFVKPTPSTIWSRIIWRFDYTRVCVNGVRHHNVDVYTERSGHLLLNAKNGRVTCTPYSPTILELINLRLDV